MQATTDSRGQVPRAQGEDPIIHGVKSGRRMPGITHGAVARRSAAVALLLAVAVGCSTPEPPALDPSAVRSPEQGAPTPDPTVKPPRKQCFNESGHESPQLEPLGAGSTAFPVTASGLIDDTHYAVSRHMSFSPRGGRRL